MIDKCFWDALLHLVENQSNIEGGLTSRGDAAYDGNIHKMIRLATDPSSDKTHTAYPAVTRSALRRATWHFAWLGALTAGANLTPELHAKAALDIFDKYLPNQKIILVMDDWIWALHYLSALLHAHPVDAGGEAEIQRNLFMSYLQAA
ncbi:hypothetical protein [Stenotrophomonas indicatrix]|jgi:hypothetical protein|uniref:hypothetical protein n=1 Tax=Stenotrophomonas indicatrix TaxID=2045451 RepID=UPI00289D3206|nr:hypothetical protein [Stenotrophomonas indicatrix]HEL3217269.1 hypothetical protein [Stenotrophomonas maltophilia]